MAKKPKHRRIRRHQYKKSYRKKKKIPIIPLATAVTIPLVPSKDGWASPYEDAKAGNWKAVGAHVINGFQPFYEVNDPNNFSGKFGLHLPRYLAMIIGGVAASKIASFFGANRIFQDAPSPLNKLKW